MRFSWGGTVLEPLRWYLQQLEWQPVEPERLPHYGGVTWLEPPSSLGAEGTW